MLRAPALCRGIEMDSRGDVALARGGGPGVDAGAAGRVDIRRLPVKTRDAFGEMGYMLPRAGGDFQRRSGLGRMVGQHIGDDADIPCGGRGVEAAILQRLGIIRDDRRVFGAGHALNLSGLSRAVISASSSEAWPMIRSAARRLAAGAVWNP